MNYRTHVCGGFAVSALLISSVGISNIGVMQSGALVGASLLGSLLPDIDKKGTYIYNRIPFIGWFAQKAGHRTLFHAPLIYTGLMFILSVLFGINGISVGLYIGIMSHILLDTLNGKGIPWLFPIFSKKFHVARIRAGSFMDSAIGVACVLLAVVVLFK